MDRQITPLWSPSQAAAQREAKRKPLFYAYMNLWPFAGVLLALLIAFMQGLSPVHRDIPVDLPGASHVKAQPRARAEDAMTVFVTRDGRVFFRNPQVSVTFLPMMIRGASQEGAEKKVYLSVDARAKYGDAAAVVNEISKTGVREICILAYKRESEPSGQVGSKPLE